MTDDFFPDMRPARPIWLVTLADLALLLVGFFVLLQANQSLDQRALARGLREGFGFAAPVEPMPVAAAAPVSFASGSAQTGPLAAGIADWAQEAVRDPNVTLKITATTDGSAADVDTVTGSAAVLAADRARAVAAALADIVPSDRLTITTAAAPTPGRRVVLVTLGFAGAASGDRP